MTTHMAQEAANSGGDQETAPPLNEQDMATQMAQEAANGKGGGRVRAEGRTGRNSKPKRRWLMRWTGACWP